MAQLGGRRGGSVVGGEVAQWRRRGGSVEEERWPSGGGEVA